jgi:hypothetical protein
MAHAHKHLDVGARGLVSAEPPRGALLKLLLERTRHPAVPARLGFRDLIAASIYDEYPLGPFI